MSVFLHRALRCLSLIFQDTNLDINRDHFLLHLLKFLYQNLFWSQKISVCVCARVSMSVCCTYSSSFLILLVQGIYANSYFCSEGSVVILLPGCWALTWELLFPCLFLQALSHVLGYLKWEHSQSSGRNSSLNFPWPQLSSRQAASPPVKHEKEAFPGLFTSSTQGWKQLHSPAQLLRNQGDQVHSQGPPPSPTSSVRMVTPHQHSGHCLPPPGPSSCSAQERQVG